MTDEHYVPRASPPELLTRTQNSGAKKYSVLKGVI